MSTASKALSPSQPAQDRFSSDKATFGGVTVLTLRGTLNQAFEGKKLADATRTKKAVVNMREVRRFASWGMSEWMDYLRITADHDVYLVECSTYAVSQINLITGLLGHAKLVSFYASFRCGGCGEELETLFLIPRDRDVIRDLPGSHQPCPTCGSQAGLEEYPASFFETIAGRPTFDIDDEVLGFMRSQLRYDLAPDLTRFRANRSTREGYTYLRLSGSMALLPPEPLAEATEGTTVVDLAQVVFSPVEVEPWRAYVAAAMPRVKSLQLLNCPLGFLESAVAIEDLHDRLKIRTFAQSYDCMRCNMAVPCMVDVAENLEHLVAGIAPPAKCPSCQSPLVAHVTPEQIGHLRALPARDRDPALEKFLAKAIAEPSEKLENCLAAPKKPPKAPAGGFRALYVALGLSTVLLGALAALAVSLWQKRGDGPPQVVIAAPPADAGPEKPTFVRPDWILADVPFSAYCHEMINRVMCVGVSTYRATRDEAVAEATDAALEELVSTIALKMSDPAFRENVMPAYNAVRSRALSVLQAADLDRTSKAYADAADVVRKARKRVAEILQASGGAAVPSQRSDWYWEEYAGEQGKGNEILVFVRYDVSLDAMKSLLERYSSTTTIQGSSVMTAFPAMAWQHADFTGGALLTKVASPFTSAGIAAQSVVMAAGEQRIADATSFARRIEEWRQGTGALQLTVKPPGEAPASVVELKRR
jgi:hypothetical protein